MGAFSGGIRQRLSTQALGLGSQYRTRLDHRFNAGCCGIFTGQFGIELFYPVELFAYLGNRSLCIFYRTQCLIIFGQQFAHLFHGGTDCAYQSAGFLSEAFGHAR